MPVEYVRTVAAAGFLLAALWVATLPQASAGTPARRSIVHTTDADRAIFERVLSQARSQAATGAGQAIAAAGLAFLGTPYVAGTLELPGAERLVCNLRGLDCVTFVESSLALARVARHSPDGGFEAFLDELAASRYRSGRPEGYESRLHYFTDWLRHNEARGVLRDITADLGGNPEDREIQYISTHRKLYPRLSSDRIFEAIRRVERELSARPLVLIPRSAVNATLPALQEGDILAIVPTTTGLDVSHTGLVHRGPDGSVNLLHASEDREVRLDPLADYVAEHRKVHGLIVARPL